MCLAHCRAIPQMSFDTYAERVGSALPVAASCAIQRSDFYASAGWSQSATDATLFTRVGSDRTHLVVTTLLWRSSCSVVAAASTLTVSLASPTRVASAASAPAAASPCCASYRSSVGSSKPLTAASACVAGVRVCITAAGTGARSHDLASRSRMVLMPVHEPGCVRLHIAAVSDIRISLRSVVCSRRRIRP